MTRVPTGPVAGSGPGRRRFRRAGLAVGLELAAAALVLLSLVPSAVGQSTSGSATTGPGSGTAQFTASETLERTADINGQKQVLDGPRTFSVSVSQTVGLHNRQVVTVDWTGAHPSGALVSNEQLAIGSLQEYPVLLMECRGVDSSTAPAGQQLSPSTCWTATPQERYLGEQGDPPLWYLDPYNTDPAHQVPFVNFPGPVCFGQGSGDSWNVPFDAADGTHYPVGFDGCGGIPPDMTVTQAPDVIPSDTTWAETNPDGTGEAKFSIETADSLPEVGCSTTVPCSLVIVPIEGTDCDTSALPSGSVAAPSDIQACEASGRYQPGTVIPAGDSPSPDPAVAGTTWFLPSVWKNHISVPLTFAPSADVCDQAGKAAPLDIYGSEVAGSATQQWNPHFCLSAGGFNVNHVQTSEPEAKNLLATGAVSAAFEAAPPAGGGSTFFPSPTVQAPVALSGFAITYVIDNADGRPYTSLKLDARLLAKLMTESYAGDTLIQSGDPGIKNNPITVWDDPEMRALNPGLTVVDGHPLHTSSAAAATLFDILGRSDVVQALTSYITADPEARAWLDGQPDPWGMVVNPFYKGIQLPVDSWPLLDSVNTGPDYDPLNNQCLHADPVPARPLLDAPQSNFAQVALNMAFGYAPSQDICVANPNGIVTELPLGTQPVGSRFLIAVVPLADAYEYSLDTAALETYRSPDAPAQFTDPTNRLFESPTTASLQAAAAVLQPDPTDGSWQMPYSDFPTDLATAAAYPGAMLVSLDVPTQGLSKSDAADLSQYLSYVSTTGQAPGFDIGQLAPGYLPLTLADHLGDQLAYTRVAAADVAAQNGEVPPLVPSAAPAPAPTTTTTVPRSTTTTAAGGAFPSGGSVSGAGLSDYGSSAVTPLPSSDSALTGSSGSGTSLTAGPASVPPPRTVPVRAAGTPAGGGATGTSSGASAAAVGTTAGFSSAAGQMALPAALVLALLGGGVAASPRLGARRRRRP